MMTKTQFAKSIVRDAKHALGRSVEPADIYQSSSLAVAMEFLGLLSNEELDYARTRGGCIALYMEKGNEPVILSTRDVLNLLPDELPTV